MIVKLVGVHCRIVVVHKDNMLLGRPNSLIVVLGYLDHKESVTLPCSVLVHEICCRCSSGAQESMSKSHSGPRQEDMPSQLFFRHCCLEFESYSKVNIGSSFMIDAIIVEPFLYHSERTVEDVCVLVSDLLPFVIARGVPFKPIDGRHAFFFDLERTELGKTFVARAYRHTVITPVPR